MALQVWLRRRLGFDGVIITDDLEMGGISTNLPAPQGAKEALAAGADLLLICNNWQAAWETARLLAADASLAPRGREAAARLDSLRQSLPAQGSELKLGAGILRPAELNLAGEDCKDKGNERRDWRQGQGWPVWVNAEDSGRCGYDQPPKNIMAGRGTRPFGERRNWFRVFSGVTCF